MPSLHGPVEEGGLGLSQRKAAEVLGVDPSTVRADLGLRENPSLNEGKSLTSSQLVQQSLSNEHYTPPRYIEAARTVLGNIDLDPASCVEANAWVKADAFYSEGSLEVQVGAADEWVVRSSLAVGVRP
jgi:hypothetical protein